MSSSIQPPPPPPPLPTSSSAPDPLVTSSSSSWRRNSEKKERMVRTFSNLMIIIGTLVCLGLGIAAVNEETSDRAIFVVVLLPAVFGGGCLLTLVNISWMYRHPGSRCSCVQVVCNMVFGLMITYVELLFWPERRDVALAILLAVALPMFIFLNMPSAFKQEANVQSYYVEDDDANTVVMGDDEHSLFDMAPSIPVTAQGNCDRLGSEDMPDLEQQVHRQDDIQN